MYTPGLFAKSPIRPVAPTAGAAGLIAVLALAALSGIAATSSTSGIVCDGTTDTTAAVQAAVDNGGTVTLPPGTCLLSSAIVLRNGSVTLQGSVSSTGQLETTLVDSINPQYHGGDVQIKSDHNTVQDLILDQHLYGGTLYVQGNYNVIQRDRILGGPNFFAVFAVALRTGAKAVGNQFLNDTAVSLIDKNVLGTSTQPCDDGLSISNQSGALLQNIDFTGTRLALYHDVNTSVNGYTYHPGPQSCGLDGFYITQPSSGIALQNLTMFGSAGVISNGSSNNGYSQNITINSEVVHAPAAGTGFTLNGKSQGLLIRNVSGVTVDQSNFASGNASNDTIVFEPTTSATSVIIENTTVPKVSFWGSTPVNSTLPGYTSGLSLNNDSFPTPAASSSSSNDETFTNGTGAPVSFAAAGGSWTNQDVSDTLTLFGLYKGSLTATTCSLVNVLGYTGPPSPW